MIKICWITSSFLLDVDIPLVPVLQKEYDIDWTIITTKRNYEGDIALIESTGCKKYDLVLDKGVFISPMELFFYRKIISKAKANDYDLYYFDLMGMPYLFPLVQIMLPKNRVVIATHNVKTPKGARYYWMAKTYMDYVIKTFSNFQVFSLNQLHLLQSLKRDASILYAPLCLKDYGKPNISKPDSPITFLFFGNIVEYKRVDLLLKAVFLLKQRGITDFKVKIAGYCRAEKWKNSYERLCQGLDNIELDIRRIPNEAIPDLFESSHYFVMPYQDIAQSGAMTVALQYNIPIIASELDTFKEFMNGKTDGYFFKPGSAEQLADTMRMAILRHNDDYIKMRENQTLFVKEKLSTEAILLLYKKYFNTLCQN